MRAAGGGRGQKVECRCGKDTTTAELSGGPVSAGGWETLTTSHVSRAPVLVVATPAMFVAAPLRPDRVANTQKEAQNRARRGGPLDGRKHGWDRKQVTPHIGVSASRYPRCALPHRGGMRTLHPGTPKVSMCPTTPMLY